MLIPVTLYHSESISYNLIQSKTVQYLVVERSEVMRGGGGIFWNEYRNVCNEILGMSRERHIPEDLRLLRGE